MSEQTQCSNNPDVTLYRQPHSDAIGSFDDKLFLSPPNGIGIEVGGMVYVKPLKEWHKLESQLSQEQTRSRRLREALEKIKDQDYRGNRCSCSGIAFKALADEAGE